MTDAPEDPRHQAILNSAFQAFSTYGFRKTSMDDIARGAGMSRPAVYLHYKNKDAIVRSLTRAYYQDKTAAVAAALRQGGTIRDLVSGAITAQAVGMAAILASPHGVEMLDTSKSTAADIVAEGEEALAQVYAEWLRREDAGGRVNLPDGAEETARTITASLKGIKLTSSGADEFEKRTAQLAALIGAGLEVR